MLRWFFLIFFCCNNLFSQDIIPSIIILDEVKILENNRSLSAQDFMRIVKEDTTFYKAFKHLRYYSHLYTSNLDVLNKKGRVKANIYRSGRHIRSGDSAWIIDDTIYHSGRVYKRNGDYRYYTPEAFDKVFFPKDTFQVSLSIRENQNAVNKKSREDKNVRDAKTIGFTVGSSETEQKKGSLSRKLAIFDSTMHKYYDYIIDQTLYQGIDCYSFTCQVKDSLTRKENKQTLIKKITSYFDKGNFNVLYRDISFKYRSLLIKLDMNIIVRMSYVSNKHVPVEIIYNGFWDLPFFKAERVNFKLILYDYEI